ncbi:hypothetical protein TEA_018286 [Camellia sinensis var. sinensis]|uniref:Rad60/SUMO-like domain-containing protein n=1 Tax=Camellia sinensis var. sinensis TaxID=542762 RepID=A0A4V3WKV4_CAMSN|nr:hypothetical protein TEA_018286 [Camellia sinensis var. sinensis]
MGGGGGGKGRVCRKGWRGREEREIEGGLVVAVAAMVAGDRVVAEDGNEVFFRIKRSTQLRKLMTAYCDRQSVEFNSIAFLFDGRRLRGEQTPDEVMKLMLCCIKLAVEVSIELSSSSKVAYICMSDNVGDDDDSELLDGLYVELSAMDIVQNIIFPSKIFHCNTNGQEWSIIAI